MWWWGGGIASSMGGGGQEDDFEIVDLHICIYIYIYLKIREFQIFIYERCPTKYTPNAKTFSNKPDLFRI